MRQVRLAWTAQDDLGAFPKSARIRAGHELFMVQAGRDPDDWKPMSDIGPGVCEIHIRDSGGAYRVIYVAKFAAAVYVLHAFQKKTEKTSPPDLELAWQRYRIARELGEGENHA